MNKTDLLSAIATPIEHKISDHLINGEPIMQVAKSVSEPRVHYKLSVMPLTIKKGYAGSYWKFLEKCLKKGVPVRLREIIKEWDWDGKYKMVSINGFCATFLPIDEGRKQILLQEDEFKPTFYLEIGGDK